jgi:hypothetical protein
MLSKLDFKTWLTESALAVDEKNIINILKNAFGFTGESSDDKFKMIQFRDIDKKEPGPKGKEMDVGIIPIIKKQQFYQSLDPSSPVDAAKINALNNLDPVRGRMGDIVDIMVGTGAPQS